MLLKLLDTIIGLYVMVLLLRVWMQWARCDFYNPLSQSVVKLTQPLVKPLRRILPPLGPIDTASLLLALIICILKFPLLLMLQEHVLFFDKVFLLAGGLSLLKTAGTLIFWIVIVRSLMSWISQGRSPVEYVLMQLTEPLMEPIRRILPAMGGIDFSGMIVILILYMLNYLGMNLFPLIWFQI
ncbi:YggT family protein [Izhakiella capsodis]|uniref:YggT family protein n=1 Tax=Izhakiella capsodis TaxID=1367852 RepID=A0A1I4W269_9GAMM|nr:YggT family protein [Izhakiella capsodis]SFN07555.1 YggT family protein [Izhakiella capsodis]